MRWHLWRLIAAALCLGAAAMTGAQATLIQAKAWLGPVLIERAWEDRAPGDAIPPPWPWADMHPVAMLSINGGKHVPVLSDASGASLAWGAGHLPATATIGDQGTAIIAAHRDTHFGKLRDARPDMPIVADGPDGQTHHYRIVHREVVDTHRHVLDLPETGRWLLLSTCYPFDAADPNGPLRFLVWAVADGTIAKEVSQENQR